MLIIFDLDDTLIDTSGCVTPFKMRECLSLLCRNGLQVHDFEIAYQRLLKINSRSLKSKDALHSFVEELGYSTTLVEKVLNVMTGPLPQNFSVHTTPEAKEILQALRKKHQLALVTAGYAPFQFEKLEKAGIDRAIFSNIAVPENSGKKPFYAKLIQEFSISPKDCIVCGDRVLIDLLPAFELGMQTVHMKWGRGKDVNKQDWVNAQISSLSELKRIVQI